MSHRGGGSEKGLKSVTYYLNGPQVICARVAIYGRFCLELTSNHNIRDSNMNKFTSKMKCLCHETGIKLLNVFF